ncbi:dethiobiotin synthetase [Flexibacter flexilis DSM 6793]|uniref:ATP-dependent dethiobiotin synthetase BioD n=1 Tax=Flexibacter flexilis DSM 6793 TaxID=927664 RepID=A0A1I1MUJ9_9BACT|nr:dethiobiotin synthase [Flexibacter flexilis]SFC88592.1 dethiobiotin synthetase [Flexibacter flexilis DSM 6793]
MRKLFVTAIGTDSGKTLASAILTQNLQADYWKPIQAGTPRDTDRVRTLVDNAQTQFWPEAYFLQMPASPHKAAANEDIIISLDNIQLPDTQNDLVVEGAGGLLVPLNRNGDFVIDIAARLRLPIVLVCNLYLGSINHSLLSINELKRRNLPVLGLIFNGEPDPQSEDIILKHAGWPCLLRILPEPEITPEVVAHYAAQVQWP